MYRPDDPTRPCQPKAGQGIVMIMMIKMKMIITIISTFVNEGADDMVIMTMNVVGSV